MMDNFFIGRLVNCHMGLTANCKRDAGIVDCLKISLSKYRRTNWFNVRGERWLGGQEDLAREG